MAWKLSIRQKTDLITLAPVHLARPVGGADGGSNDRRGCRSFQRVHLHLFRCGAGGGGTMGLCQSSWGIGWRRQSGQRDWDATAALDSLQPVPPETAHDHEPQNTSLPPALPRAARPSRSERDASRRPLAPLAKPLPHRGRKAGQPRLPTDVPLMAFLPPPAL